MHHAALNTPSNICICSRPHFGGARIMLTSTIIKRVTMARFNDKKRQTNAGKSNFKLSNVSMCALLMLLSLACRIVQRS